MNINGYTSAAQARKYLKSKYAFSKVLSYVGANPKLAKNSKLKVLSVPLHLAPYNLSGFQVCAKASAGCSAACLHFGGAPAARKIKDQVRIARTQAFFKDRSAFLALLTFEIMSLQHKAKKLHMKPAVRLNATSDLAWENLSIVVNGKTVGMIGYFRGIQFYDYTAIRKRMDAFLAGRLPRNYHLTFSRKEDNHDDCLAVLRAGGNVTAVFTKPALVQALENGVQTSGGSLVVAGGPQSCDWMVVDGDIHDYRPVDPSNVIVGLKAKGLARKDVSGFVIR